MNKYTLNYWNKDDSIQVRIQCNGELLSNISIVPDYVKSGRLWDCGDFRFFANVFVPKERSDEYWAQPVRPFDDKVGADELDILLFQIKIKAINSGFWDEDLIDFDPPMIFAEKFLEVNTKKMIANGGKAG